MLRFYEDERQFNGNVLVMREGNVIYENAVGWADRENGIGLLLNTPFYLASIAKPITATAVMILVEDGLVNYDDKVVEYLPETGIVGSKITIHHLLSHTSGVPDYFREGWSEPGITNALVYSRWIQSGLKLYNKPGQKYAYSNTGYVLLALIVERASGMPFYQFVDKNIFQPLGMKDSWVHDLRNPGIFQRNRAIGYDLRLKKQEDYDLLTWGDGGMYSTIGDLERFDRGIRSGELLSPASLNAAFTRIPVKGGSKSDYGYGWVIGNNTNGRVISHTGGLAGFRNYFEMQLDVDITIIILTNNSNDDVMQIRNTLVKILDGRPYDFPESR